MERLGFWGGCFCFWREKKREEGGREEGDMGVMWGGRRESFMILFWEKEREEEEREDRIKSAMGI